MDKPGLTPNFKGHAPFAEARVGTAKVLRLGFIPVEVELGREVGERTEVRRGLNLNDVVVVSGQFLIDSEASLAGLIERLGRTPTAAQQQSERIQAEGIVKFSSPPRSSLRPVSSR